MRVVDHLSHAGEGDGAHDAATHRHAHHLTAALRGAQHALVVIDEEDTGSLDTEETHDGVGRAGEQPVDRLGACEGAWVVG